MVRSRPDVEENQRPEVKDRQPVAEDRALRRLRKEVVHEAQDGRGQQESDRIVPVPPLHQGVGDPREHRVAARERGRHGEVVHDVEHGDGEDHRHVEPDRYVEVLDLPDGEGTEDVLIKNGELAGFYVKDDMLTGDEPTVVSFKAKGSLKPTKYFVILKPVKRRKSGVRVSSRKKC